MTNAQKVALVEEAWKEYGLTRALAAVDLAKSVWYYHRNQKVSYASKYGYLLTDLQEIARRHPAYGWPRVTVELRERYGHRVNHKVVQRLLHLWDLRLARSTHRPGPSKVQRAIQAAGERANLVAQLSEISLFQVMYTDFTELPFANGKRKAYLMPIIGHVSKMVYGWAVGGSSDTALALQAWEKAKATFHRLVRPGDQLVFEAELVESRAEGHRTETRVTVDGELVAESSMMFVLKSTVEPARIPAVCAIPSIIRDGGMIG